MIGQLRNHIDHWTLYPVVFLMLMSLGIVYSAGAMWGQLQKHGDSEYFLYNHAIKVFIGVITLFVGMRIDYHRIQRLSKLLIVIAVVSLLFTLILGVVAKGASRWLRYGGFGFQPSEFAKYALLFHLCSLVATKGILVRDLRRGFLPMMIWIGLVTGLVLLQPNFSMGAMISMLSLVILYLGRAKLSHLGMTFLLLIPVLAIYMVSAPYRMARILAFISGNSIDTHSTYQPMQSLLGFGNGGIFGVGPGESRQRDLFLPESYGDFVFSIVGEEWGFIGTVLVMLIFLWLLYRGLKIARYAEDEFGRMLALSVTCAIVLYGLVNAGVTIGLLPTTGLPMPFVSYGGSSMVFSAFAVGILLNISSQTDLHPRTRQVPVVGTVRADGAGIGKVY